jgi:hypothetical protein
VIRLILYTAIVFFIVRYIRQFLDAKFEWLQKKDRLTWKQGFKRNRYELFLTFDDGRFACYQLFANYTKYQAADLLLKLFEGNPFVEIEENGRVFYYRYSQIEKIESEKYPLKLGKRGLF